MLKKLPLAVLFAFIGGLAVNSVVEASRTHPQDTVLIAQADSTAEHPYRSIFSETAIAQADTPAPVKTIDPPPASGSAAAAAPAPAPTSALDELAALKDKYDELRAAQKGKSPTLLLWAALIAAALKVALSLFTRYVFKESKSWMKWVALGAAVPIALLSHFAGGFSLFDSLVFAGAGPGAIIFHELLKKKAK